MSNLNLAIDNSPAIDAREAFLGDNGTVERLGALSGQGKDAGGGL
jgi:hypothetical protein